MKTGLKFLWNDLDLDVRAQEPLAPHTTFKVGGPAEWFIRPRTVEAFADAYRRANEQDLPVRFLGGGTNLLVSDAGVRGVVFQFHGGMFEKIDFTRNGPVAGPAAPTPKLAWQGVKRRMSGFEGLAGVPGSIGGAVAMNAGGKYGEIGPLLRSLTVVERDGTFRDMEDEPILAYEYRHGPLEGRPVVEIRFKDLPDGGEEVERRWKEVIEYRRRTQPVSSKCAGCAFKNPPGHSAGKLIDEAGLKGKRVGGIVVSPVHGNFLVNEGAGTADDVRRLIGEIREEVRRRFDVDLETELQMWGF